MPSDIDNILAGLKDNLVNLNDIIKQSENTFRETILLVDDDTFQIKSANFTLNKTYNVLSNMRGHDAIKNYEQNKHIIKAILLDIRMPDISGFEVYEKIKKINPDIPIIFITGFQYDYEDSNKIIEKYEPFGYIVKNCDQEIEMVKRLLASAVKSYNQILEIKALKKNSKA